MARACRDLFGSVVINTDESIYAWFCVVAYRALLFHELKAVPFQYSDKLAEFHRRVFF